MQCNNSEYYVCSDGVGLMPATQNGNAALLIKRARVGKVAGVLSVAPHTLSWAPSDPTAAQAAMEVAVATIQSE